MDYIYGEMLGRPRTFTIHLLDWCMYYNHKCGQWTSHV